MELQINLSHRLWTRKSGSRWRPSTRLYDPNPQAWDYGTGAELRKVGGQGTFTSAIGAGR